MKLNYSKFKVVAFAMIFSLNANYLMAQCEIGLVTDALTICRELEGNGNQKSANVMPPFVQDPNVTTLFRSKISGTLSNGKDQDWFKFTSGATKATYQIIVYGLAGYRADVTNQSGKKISAYSSNGKCNQTFTLDPNQTYYLKVSYTTITSAAPYILEVIAPEQRPGSCLNPASTIPQTKSNISMMESMNNSLKIWPNPSTASFRLNNIFDNSIQIRIFDMNGRMTENVKSVNPGASFEFGNSYVPGIYIAEITNNNKRETFRLVKQ